MGLIVLKLLSCQPHPIPSTLTMKESCNSLQWSTPATVDVDTVLLLSWDYHKKYQLGQFKSTQLIYNVEQIEITNILNQFCKYYVINYIQMGGGLKYPEKKIM